MPLLLSSTNPGTAQWSEDGDSLVLGSGGNARGAGASDLQATRSLDTQVASGVNSFLGGGANNTALGLGSVCIGGRDNTADGEYAIVGGNYSYTTTFGGVALGTSCYSTNYGSIALGSQCVASGMYSVALGRNALSDTTGQIALANAPNLGTNQTSLYHLRGTTNGVNPFVLLAFNSRLVIRESMAYGFKLYVQARQSSGSAGTAGDSSLWEITGIIKRDGANNTVVVGISGDGPAAANAIASDAGSAGWDVTVTADNTNESLQIQVTGEANKFIQWSATLISTEVGV